MTKPFDRVDTGGKHPEVTSIEDLISFRLQLLVSIGERAVQDWSQRLFDLSLNEWRMLAIVKSRAPCRAGEIADLLQMDKSQASRVMKRLQVKALIVNGPDPEDGRALALELTPQGCDLYERVLHEAVRANERVLAPLSHEEIADFDRMLQKLIARSQDLLEARLGRKLIR